MDRTRPCRPNRRRHHPREHLLFHHGDRQQSHPACRHPQTATLVELPPTKHLVRVHSMPAGHPSYRCSRPQRLLHNQPTLFRTPSSTPRSCPQLTASFNIYAAMLIADKLLVHVAKTGRLRREHSSPRSTIVENFRNSRTDYLGSCSPTSRRTELGS